MGNRGSDRFNPRTPSAKVLLPKRSTLVKKIPYLPSPIGPKTETCSHSVITVGVSPGPQGAPGVSEDEMVYSTRVDFVTDTLLYRAEAAVGSLNSAAAWRIRRITIGSDQDVTTEWAEGNADFDKIWNDRADLEYV